MALKKTQQRTLSNFDVEATEDEEQVVTWRKTLHNGRWSNNTI